MPAYLSEVVQSDEVFQFTKMTQSRLLWFKFYLKWNLLLYRVKWMEGLLFGTIWKWNNLSHLTGPQKMEFS